jgi:hypothetical protein
MPWQIQIILLFILGVLQFFFRSFSLKTAKIIYCVLATLSFLWAGYVSYLQYVVWKNGPLAKFLLPPYENISYFIKYVGWRFFAPAIFVFIFSFIYILLAKLLNKGGGGRFFEDDEIYVAAAVIVSVGYPSIFVFFVSFTLIFLVFNIIQTIKAGRISRVSPYYLWIPAALIAIMISKFWLSHFSWWSQLII